MSKVTFKGGLYVSNTTPVQGEWKSFTALSANTVVANVTFADGSTASSMPVPSGTTLDVKVLSIELSGGSIFLAK